MNKRVNGYLFPKAGSKKARILDALIGGAHLTPMKALAYGTHRLAAVIHELVNLNGFAIDKRERHDITGTRYVEYKMSDASRSAALREWPLA